MSDFEIPQGEFNYFLYFLRCMDGYYYVGISQNIYHRLKQHKEGRGSVMTKQHKPIELLGVWDLGILTYQNAEYIENEFTLYFMSIYGNGVRGGSWSGKKQDVQKILEKNIPYCPCNVYDMVEINFKFKKVKIKKKKKNKKSPKMKFKNRQEQIEWICRGKK